MGMIIVTGAAGFIGSCLLSELNHRGYGEIVLVDDFSGKEKLKNLEGKTYLSQVSRDHFVDWLNRHHSGVSFVFHLGARTDTAEKDHMVFERLNLGYSKKLWNACASYGIPMVYASSAATYGAGERGYNDSHKAVELLAPLNPYGQSKQDFDRWALAQDIKPPFWAGLKFFNVYGPNEYHKNRMASAIFHVYNQVESGGVVKLFRSHRPDIKDGEQQRDFIYVKDVTDVICYLMENRVASGLYNLGSGLARSFLELAGTIFSTTGKKPEIRFTDTPEGIRDTYQYYTCADISKLREAGYNKAFHSLEEGVGDYISNYLSKGLYM